MLLIGAGETIQLLATHLKAHGVGVVYIRKERLADIDPSMFEPGADHYKYIDLPLSNYASASYDKVMNAGKTVGLSTWIGYSSNEGRMLTLAMMDADYAVPGTEVSLVWGEPNGGTKKLTVEPHKQLEVRAIVSPVPYSRVARETYAEGWRSQGL